MKRLRLLLSPWKSHETLGEKSRFSQNHRPNSFCSTWNDWKSADSHGNVHQKITKSRPQCQKSLKLFLGLILWATRDPTAYHRTASAYSARSGRPREIHSGMTSSKMPSLHPPEVELIPEKLGPVGPQFRKVFQASIFRAWAVKGDVLIYLTIFSDPTSPRKRPGHQESKTTKRSGHSAQRDDICPAHLLNYHTPPPPQHQKYARIPLTKIAASGSFRNSKKQKNTRCLNSQLLFSWKSPETNRK